MGLIRRAFDKAQARVAESGLFAPASAPAPLATATVPLREAAGVTVDNDDAEWRRLTGRSDKDLDPLTQERANKLSLHLWQSNPLANRLIELPLGYLLGKGVKLKSADPDAQTILDRHWRDCINAWPIKLVKRMRELAIHGEQCWPTFVGGNGFVRVGYLDPRQIETVVMDPDNAEQPIGIVTRKDRKGNARKFKVIVNGPESVFTDRTQQIRAGFEAGECFYFRINDLCNGTRGRGDLTALLDWLDAYDEFLFGELDRADFMRAFIWDVTMKGAVQTEVDARAKKITAPGPGAVRVHNDSEEWKAVTPELQAADGSTAARMFRNHMLGGATMPEHWFGGAADVNRATGDSMAEPTEKMYEMRQTYLTHVLVEVATYVLRAAWDLRDEENIPEAQQKILDALEVEWPEMTTKDTTSYAAALQQVVVAVASAISEGLITKATGLAIVAALAKQIGVNIDVEKELAAAQAEVAANGGSYQDALSATPPAMDAPTDEGAVARNAGTSAGA